MTKTEIAVLLNENFYERFAQKVRDIIIEKRSVKELFLLLDDLIKGTIPDNEYYGIKKNLSRTEFRAAYVLDNVYFFDNKYFNEYYELFFDIFPFIKNGSTKRHFAKIAANILIENVYQIEKSKKEIIAGTCLDWVASPKVKVAVKVWAVEVLIVLKEEFEWIDDALRELLYDLSLNPTPGIKVRLKKWKNIISFS